MKNHSFLPYLIHQITGPKATPLVNQCFDSWRILKQYGFKIVMWDDFTLSAFLREQYPFALDAFSSARNHAEASDIARYLVIHSFGGYYIDWDIELLNKERFIDLGNKHRNGYMLKDYANGTIASEFFCAMQGDPYLLNLSQDIVELFANKKRESLSTPFYSGPYRMQQSLNLHPKTSMSIISIKDAFAYGYREIRNIPFNNPSQPMIHYWAHSWLPTSI